MLGCRRGWWRVLGLAAFALAGYFALYGWLRATDVIELIHWSYPTNWIQMPEKRRYSAILRSNPAVSPERLSINADEKWPQSWAMKAMWPAVKMEVELDRRGWMPWSGIRKRFAPPPSIEFF